MIFRGHGITEKSRMSNFLLTFYQKGKTFWLTEAKGRAILLSTDTLTLLFIDWFPGAPADPKGRSGKCFSP
jgi:hypothetical protein